MVAARCQEATDGGRSVLDGYRARPGDEDPPILDILKRNLRIVVMVAVVAVLSVVGTAMAAFDAVNADKVDGKHAVKAKATIENRKGKLVATSATSGRLPNNIIRKAPNADRLDGLNSSAFVQDADLRTDTVTCAGGAFTSADSTAGHATSGTMLYGTTVTPRLLVRCNVPLPDDAEISAVSFSVKDTNAATDAKCQMYRTDLVTYFGNVGIVANVASSGTPGQVRLQAASLTNTSVDTETYAYYLQCFLGSDATIGLYGAMVSYAISADGSAPPTAAASTSSASAPDAPSR